MADKERLVGSDGKLVRVTLGTELTGDGTDTVDELAGGLAASGAGEGWYQITEISDGTTGFPEGLAVGDLWWSDGTDVLDAGTGSDDKVKPLTETEMTDISSFSIEISRNEIDVTPLGSTFTMYRSGKRDMSGSLEGITTLGKTDSDGWVINNFIRSISQASAGTVTVSEVDDAPIYLKGVLQKDTSAGEKEAFIWAQVILLSTNLGASGEDAQSFSSSFRIAADSDEPTLYIREVAST